MDALDRDVRPLGDGAAGQLVAEIAVGSVGLVDHQDGAVAVADPGQLRDVGGYPVVGRAHHHQALAVRVLLEHLLSLLRGDAPLEPPLVFDIRGYVDGPGSAQNEAHEG